MRCFICDKPLSEPIFNRDYQSYDPCGECLDAINDTIAGFKDRPSADEDELGQFELPLDFSDLSDLSTECVDFT